MAHLPHRCHGNFPQRQATPLPRVAKSRAELALTSLPSETSSNPATSEEPNLQAEHLGSIGFCKVESESYLSCSRETRAASPSTRKQQRKPGKQFAAFLKRISIHPEAQKILGNSCIPVVTLERLNLQSVLSSSSLQPVVSLVRLPCQSQAELHSEPTCLDCPQQNGFSQTEEHILDKKEPKPAESPDLSHPDSTPTSWTEPLCPDNSLFEEPEQDSGFDCESNPDQAYILFDLGSEEWDQDVRTNSETFYLDPDSDQNIVIEVDPELEPDQDQSLELVDESETKCEGNIVQNVDNEDQRPDLCCSKEEVDSCILQPGPGPGPEEIESEDFCAVCLNGGDLLCCDRCPKVYHLACHVPPLISFPLGDWVCTLCRTDQEPVEMYDCENTHSCGGLRAPYTLPQQDQRRCEKLTLLLYCHTLSAPFHEPVSPLARNYYQIIKRPINLSVIRRKLDKNNTLHYFSAEQFVDDVLLMFKNCATFNYPDSEVAQAGRNLEVFFLSKLMEIFPERTFPSTSQGMADKARLRWLSKKRKENHRRKRYVFTGKKYYL